MTIVATGFGIDSLRVGPVVFGYTLKFGSGPIAPQILSSSIEQWYVIDYRVKRRRPLTAFEWRLLREYVEIRDRQAKRQRRARAEDARLRAQLAAQDVELDSYAPRLSAARDWSGLQPIKHVVGNPTAGAGKFRTDGDTRAAAGDPTRLRESVRGQPARGPGPGGPNAQVRSRPRIRGRDRRNSQERLSSRRP